MSANYVTNLVAALRLEGEFYALMANETVAAINDGTCTADEAATALEFWANEARRCAA